MSLPGIPELAEAVESKIAATPIFTDPFPHIIVEDLLSPDLYDVVLRTMPSLSEFTAADYPGTGAGHRTGRSQDFGYAYFGFREAQGPLGLLHGLFSSERFARVLLEKFRWPLPDGFVPIPPEKHHFFIDGARSYTTVFDLQVDLPGYAIPPHKDLPSKIVTFQFYLTADTSLRGYGTLLCKPKDRRGLRTPSPLARFLAAGVRQLKCCEPILRTVRRSGLEVFLRRFEHSRIGLRLGVGSRLPWEWFDVVKVTPALPNHLLAFAPNDRSFHAVNFDVPAEHPHQQRRVIRGFIMSGHNAKNLIRARASIPRGD